MTEPQFIQVMMAEGLDDALNHRLPKFSDVDPYSIGYGRGEAINNGG